MGILLMILNTRWHVRCCSIHETLGKRIPRTRIINMIHSRSRYSIFFLTVPLFAGAALLASSFINPACADPAASDTESSVAAPMAESTVAPDNSAMNKRDRSGENVTALDQS